MNTRSDEPRWLFLDIETGGFDRKKHAILEIGWAVLNWGLDPLTGDSICIRPEPGFEIAPEAAQVNGYTAEGWEERNAVSLQEAQSAVASILGPYVGLPKLAHNALSMDKPWIEQYFPFLSPPGSEWICTMQVLRKYCSTNKLPTPKGTLSLSNLCKLADYRQIDRHSAMEDCYAGAAGARWLVSKGMVLH